MTLITLIRDLLTLHVPDENRPCWANERWCKGCETSWRTWPWSEYPKHQADLIMKIIRNFNAGSTPMTSRRELAATLADMDSHEINALRHEELVRREREEEQRRAHQLDDPAGTVRYDPQDDVFYVRRIMTAAEHISGKEYRYWSPYHDVSSGEPVADKFINQAKPPVVGKISVL